MASGSAATAPAGGSAASASGIADRLRVDPLLIRALAVVLLFTGGVGLIIYLVACCCSPTPRGRVMLRAGRQRQRRRDRPHRHPAVVMFSGLSFQRRTVLDGQLALPAVLIAPRRDLARQPRRLDHGAARLSPATNPMAYAAPAGPADLSAQGGTMSTTYAPSPTILPVPGPSGTSRPPEASSRPCPDPSAHRRPPRPQRRRAPRGFRGGRARPAVPGYGLGLVPDGPTEFNGSGPFLSLLIALGISSLAALGLGLTGRRGGFASVLTLLFIVPVGSPPSRTRSTSEPDSARVVT